jgi:hypothetical protein
MNSFFKITAYNTQSLYFWGNEEQCDRYTDWLNRDREINMYSFTSIPESEWTEYEDRDDVLSGEEVDWDDFMEEPENGTAIYIVRCSNNIGWFYMAVPAASPEEARQIIENSTELEDATRTEKEMNTDPDFIVETYKIYEVVKDDEEVPPATTAQLLGDAGGIAMIDSGLNG